MSEEQKEALEILKGLEFEDYDWYVKTDKLEGHADDVVIEVEKAMKTILNLIDKQQKEIEFYKIQELGYIQGYEDGKSHKQTAIAIKNENAEQELIQRKIETQQKEIEKLKSKKYIFNAETNEIKEIPISDDYISKDKIKCKIEELKNRKIGASTGIFAVQVDILEELLGE